MFFANTTSYSVFSLLTTHGMNHPNVSDDTMWTGWSFCNQAQEPEIFANGLHLPSPRRALCRGSHGNNNSTSNSTMEYDNNLTFPTKIPNWRDSTATTTTPDEYARAKELYLCQTYCHNAAWQVMFKSGNLDQSTKYLCRKTEPSNSTPFNNLPMNQPLMVYHYHNRRRRQDDDDDDDSLSSSYVAGTYDTNPHWNDFQTNDMATALHQYTMDWINYYDDKHHGDGDDVDNSVSKKQPPPPPLPPALLHNSSYLYTSWKWTPGRGLVYQNMIVTSTRYPWLMNYLRSNDDSHANNPPGYGGYPWRGAGNLQGPIANNNADGYKLVLQVRLAIFQQPNTNTNHNNNNNNNNRQSELLFYMPELSGCWKRSDGSPCDAAGDDNVLENLTRYLCFSVSALPSSSPCHVTSPHRCPPWHYSPRHREWISASNTTHYPYECYHQYCGPYGRHGCDPYSNPIPQELVQLKTCHEWGYYGFPTEPISTTTTVVDRNALTRPLWHLNIGDLGNALYFYDAKYNDGTQAPKDISNRPYPRQWISVEVGPEVGIGSARNNDREASAVTRWEISDWDVLMVPEEEWKNRNSIADI